MAAVAQGQGLQDNREKPDNSLGYLAVTLKVSVPNLSVPSLMKASLVTRLARCPSVFGRLLLKNIPLLALRES
jgi:hypothetical protein